MMTIIWTRDTEGRLVAMWQGAPAKGQRKAVTPILQKAYRLRSALRTAVNGLVENL